MGHFEEFGNGENVVSSVHDNEIKNSGQIKSGQQRRIDENCGQ